MPPAGTRRTALFDEHVALGADMAAYTWAGMALPWSYRTPLVEEQRAVRERVGLADVSQLQIVRVRGPRALAVLERLVPRRLDDLPVGASRFSVVLSRFGKIADEGLILRLAEDELWISHGAGATRAQLAKLADPGAEVTPLDDTHALSLQGPASRELLAPLADVDVGALPFLGHARARLGDRAVVISRSGFTGELGFEIFCAAEDAVALWRLLLAAGAPLGVLPYGYRAIDLLRIEAGFALYPAELAMAASIWEAGLGWLIRDKAADYVGRAAVEQARGTATHRLAGVRVPGAEEVTRGSALRIGDRSIGIVTSSAASPAAAEALCLARIERDAFAPDAEVVIATSGPDTRVGRLAALPFRARRGLT